MLLTNSNSGERDQSLTQTETETETDKKKTQNRKINILEVCKCICVWQWNCNEINNSNNNKQTNNKVSHRNNTVVMAWPGYSAGWQALWSPQHASTRQRAFQFAVAPLNPTTATRQQYGPTIRANNYKYVHKSRHIHPHTPTKCGQVRIYCQTAVTCRVLFAWPKHPSSLPPKTPPNQSNSQLT